MKKSRITKQFSAILLAVLLLLGTLPASASVWDGTAAEGFAGGSGTESDPYLIGTAEELAFFAASVNSGQNYLGSYIVLTADITLNSVPESVLESEDCSALTGNQWTPIGKTNRQFLGTFDGNSHSITGLVMNTGDNYCGLFGCVGPAGTVQNVTVTKSLIVCNSNSGFIAAENRGTVRNCGATVSMISSTEASASNIGGIVGKNACAAASAVTVDGCTFSGVASFRGIDIGGCGGIVGANIDTNTANKITITVSNCTNRGTVTGTGRLMGGIVGANRGGTVQHCINYGTVEGAISPAGIAGYNWAEKKPSSVIGCQNLGDITSTQLWAGGIVGESKGDGENAATVRDCTNTGAISGEDEVGGIVANICAVDGASSTVTRCINAGTVTAVAQVGGITGSFHDTGDTADNQASITNCLNLGAVQGVRQVGGILGFGKGTVRYCLNNGSVSGTTNIGGIIGQSAQGVYGNLYLLPEGRMGMFGNLTSIVAESGNLTEAQVQDKNLYSGFNFTSIWTDANIDRYHVPMLATLKTEFTKGLGCAHHMIVLSSSELSCTTDHSEERFCIFCAETETKVFEEATGHSVTEWTVIREADEFGDGERQGRCPVCGQTVTEIIPIIGWNNPFVDVSEDVWYHNFVKFCYLHNLMAGTDATHFSPSVKATRAMFVSILYRMEGSPSVQPSTFTDVPAGSWFADAVAWARESGVVSGTSATTFSPNMQLSREQMVTMLYNYYRMKDPSVAPSGSISHFSDAGSVSGWALNGVRWAVANGIINGNGLGLLNPQGIADRATIATIFAQVNR